MESGWDPNVKKYLLKVMNSFFLGLIWLIACATAGIYFQLAWSAGKPLIYTILFYVGMAASLCLLLRYYYLTWRK